MRHERMMASCSRGVDCVAPSVAQRGAGIDGRIRSAVAAYAPHLSSRLFS